jgi:hypothetical protein
MDGTCEEMMKPDNAATMVREIMADFVRLTGLSPEQRFPRRYLWTDAFAVCNLLGLFVQTGQGGYRQLALRLVDQVHESLGRHREGGQRTGWISGLPEEEGREHPTMGGLRIGKALDERGPREPFEERLEWDRDGQYYHYLTKWMHALNRVTGVTGDFTCNRWAMELAKTAHARFVDTPAQGRQKRMYWKMSIDLSRPLVPSMGQHDPLDGLITYMQLQEAGARDPHGLQSLDLSDEIADMVNMCRGGSWATDDPLGLGGLLTDAFRVGQLMVRKQIGRTDLLGTLLESASLGFESYRDGHPFHARAAYRLAFRELGLSIGLRAVEKLRELVEDHHEVFDGEEVFGLLKRIIAPYGPLRKTIEEFWLDPASREAATWTEHRDINMVMLATSLSPDGYLKV